jgi:hypothetical protein
LIFVSALCPWLRKYRAVVRDEPAWEEVEDEEAPLDNRLSPRVVAAVSSSREELLERELERLRFRNRKLVEVTCKLSNKIQSLEADKAKLLSAAKELEIDVNILNNAD